MHYFPSTFDEMLSALWRLRHELNLRNLALPRLVVLGRFEEMELLRADTKVDGSLRDRVEGTGKILGIPYRVDRTRARAFEIIPG